MIMIRNKGLQLLALAFILTMLFSVSVLAGEVETQDAEGVAQSTVEGTAESVEQAGDVTTTVEAYSYYPVYDRAFEYEFVVDAGYFDGKSTTLRIPTYLEIEYSYSEGNWYEVYFSNVVVYLNKITSNGESVAAGHENYKKTSSGCYRTFWVGVGDLKRYYVIYIRCDEWGWECGIYQTTNPETK